MKNTRGNRKNMIMVNSSSRKSLEFTKISRPMVSFSLFIIAFVFLYCTSFSNFGEVLPTLDFSFFCDMLPLGDEMIINDQHTELRKVLKATATKDKTVILATLNEAWAAPNSIFDLFLESFKIGNNTAWLLNHLLVIAVDDKAYSRCRTSVSHCYFLKTNKSSEFAAQANFMTPQYLDIIWQRLDFLHTILSLGYNFINTDTDVMWFRDPLPYLASDSDFQTSCDFFRGKEFNMKNLPNVGFMFVRSNNRTIKFYKFWVASRHLYPNLHEQDVFNKLKYGRYIIEIGLKVRFLDTDYFGGFCSPSKDFNKVCTMHANCCKGLAKKIADLNATLIDWKSYISSNQIASKQFNWSVPKSCDWRRSPKWSINVLKTVEKSVDEGSNSKS